MREEWRERYVVFCESPDGERTCFGADDNLEGIGHKVLAITANGYTPDHAKTIAFFATMCQ